MKGKIDLAMVNEVKGALIMLYLYQFGAFVLLLLAKLFSWPNANTVNVGGKFVEVITKISKTINPIFKPFVWIAKFFGGIILALICIAIGACVCLWAYVREYIIKKREVNANA